MRKQELHFGWTRLGLCAIAGVVVSFSVAWVKATKTDTNQTSNPIPQSHYQTVDKGYGWLCWETQTNSSLSITCQAFDADSKLHSMLPLRQKPSWSTITQIPTTADVLSYDLFLEEAYGWPMPCVVSIVGGNPDRASWRVFSGIEIGSHRLQPGIPRVLPIKPIWTGLAVDTAVYGVVVLFLIRIFASIRSAIRVKRGLCRGCGYTMHTLNRCPECGLLITKQKKTVPRS